MNTDENFPSEAIEVTSRMHLIRYPLQVVPAKDLYISPEIARQYTWMDQIAKRERPSHLALWFESETPIFHPGLVLASEEVMIRLGRTEVLFYLNCFVRGGSCDGASAGEDYTYRRAFGLMLWSVYWFTDELALSIQTNASRTCTVIRFVHERLKCRRRMQEHQHADTCAEVCGVAVAEDEPF